MKCKPYSFSGLLLLITFLSLLRSTNPSYAATAVVGNGTAASCTENALKTAAASGGHIHFNCGAAPHTITLTNDLLIALDATLDGGNLITLSGGNSTRVLQIADYVVFTLQNITIRDGKEPGADGSGSGLFGGYRSHLTLINTRFENNDGTAGDKEQGGGAVFVKAGSRLTVRDSAFIGNRGINGGAINSLLTQLTVLNSTFVANDARTFGGLTSQGEGGAIYTDGASEYIDDALGSTIVIRDSSFISNTSRGQGGAIFAWAYPPDTLTLDNNRFLSNTVTVDPLSNSSALGGGLRIGNAQATVSNSLFAYNLARSQGGAFWTEGLQPITFTNVTFAYNRALSDTTPTADGLGGAMAGGGNWTCIHCTIAFNHAGHVGGGIFGSANSRLLNSIVAFNTAANEGNPWNIQQNCSQPLAASHSLQFPAARTNDPNDFNCAPIIAFADPKLSALADHGGASMTLALQVGSPAINAGDPLTCIPLDQRGYLRNGVCDLGAYEFNGALFNPTHFVRLPLIVR